MARWRKNFLPEKCTENRVRRRHVQGFESSGVCTHSLGLEFGPASWWLHEHELSDLPKAFTPLWNRCGLRLLWAFRGTIQRKGLVWCLGHQYSVNVSFLEKRTPQMDSKGAGLTHHILLWPFSYLIMKDKMISTRPKYSDSWPREQDMVPENNSQRGSAALLRKPDVLAGEEDSCRWRVASLTRWVKASCSGSGCEAVPELHNSGQIPRRARFKMSFNDGVF